MDRKGNERSGDSEKTTVITRIILNLTVEPLSYLWGGIKNTSPCRRQTKPHE